MLIPLSELIRKHNIQITGVIHVGAHYGEEDKDYLKHGIKTRHYFEPHPDTFRKLISTVQDADYYQVALGAAEGVADLYEETFNTGQSNSLLKPGTHLKHYPLITFDTYRVVQVKTLDSFNITNCNFLNIDVQGYELEVLKGATNTLQYIDYIYTEVNTDEVYIGCGKLNEIDAYLQDFDRVELCMTSQGWGDALYIRRKQEPEYVPYDFRPHHPLQYPKDNDMIFEEWYYEQRQPKTERVYLPVFWTSYYCKFGYGKNKMAIQKLQKFLKGLNRNKKYYTILQYDDGILNDISHLDIEVFASAGNRIDYPLPLICKPHAYKFNAEKDIICSYVGTNNHPIRTGLMKYKSLPNWYISDKPHSLEQFCKILARSKYILCPRGYGATSFRIMEALQYGAIPVYISDDFIIPHYVDDYMILTNDFKPEELKEIDITDAFEKYFTYEANKQLIWKKLRNQTL